MLDGRTGPYWLAPIVADAEAGFGGPLNAFELMKAMIEAGAAAVHFEDQLSSAKKCGHLGGKVVVPIREFVQKLIAARLAADVMGVPTVLIARTDADAARLLLSDVDPRDEPFLTGGRTEEGFFHYRGGMDAAIARGLAYAPLRMCSGARRRSRISSRRAASRMPSMRSYPGKLLAYNCSPSFHWKKLLTDTRLRSSRHSSPPGIQVSVRDAGGFPLPERRDVRTVAGLRMHGHERVCAAAGAGVRAGRKRRIFRHPASDASSARAISMPCRPPSRAALRRRKLWMVLPRRRSLRPRFRLRRTASIPGSQAVRNDSEDGWIER